MLWKTPDRPNGQISRSFPDGVVKIYNAENAAKPGYAPEIKKTLKATLPYEERRLGIQRFYSGAQNQTRIQRVLRVPRGVKITNRDIAESEDGALYRIDLVQAVTEGAPPALDVQLVEYTQGASL